VFDHVGADTFAGSLLVLKPGGRYVTCGATSGPSASINLMQLFQRQYRIIGSFACTLKNIAESLEKMAQGITPVIDTEVPMSDVARALQRMEDRQVFGKIIVHF
jgi:alcohol dehydrogenase